MVNNHVSVTSWEPDPPSTGVTRDARELPRNRVRDPEMSKNGSGGVRLFERDCLHDSWNRKLGPFSWNLEPTPWKINMEPTNHPFRKENDLPHLHDYVPC